MSPRFFRTAADFRRWLEKHHARETELWVGYYKKDSGKKSITHPEAVDEALCFGWIDGIRKKLDDVSYVNRFTPRKPTSNWSAVNIARVEALEAEGRMTEAGRRAFAAQKAERTGVYSFEQKQAPKLDPALEKKFRANRPAWTFFQAQPPSYRRVTTWWVISAKKEETRIRRLEKLLEASAKGERLQG